MVEEETEEKVTELLRIFEISKKDPDILTICATVATGFEWTAIDECREKISEHLRAFKDRGKIYFNISSTDFQKVALLRSVDNIYLVSDVKYISFDKDNKENNITIFKDLVHNNTELKKYLSAWKQFSGFPGKLYPTLEEYKSVVEAYKAEKEKRDNDMKDKSPSRGERKRGCDPTSCEESDVLAYRVTCERSGTHNYESKDVACAMGGEFQDKFNWIVDLTTYQLEILCRINDDELVVNLRITPESLHRRNIVEFGPTTLRATICYNLLKLANPKPGDIIVDPMCGGSSIPIEGALEFSSSYIFGGDINSIGMRRSKINFEGLKKNCKADLVQWSITKLPFKDSSVDAFVTDLPFGKRSGSTTNNRVLYRLGLLEMCRVARQKYGRLVLLTWDRRSISMAFNSVKDYVSVKKTLNISMGGLNAAAYVLKRTNFPYQGRISRTKEKSNSPENSSD